MEAFSVLHLFKSLDSSMYAACTFNVPDGVMTEKVFRNVVNSSTDRGVSPTKKVKATAAAHAA
jgi:hypothetical protein